MKQQSIFCAVIVAIAMFTAKASFSQAIVGKYSSGNYIVYLAEEAKQAIWNAIKDSSGYTGNLKEVYIDDDAPTHTGNYPYLTFVGYDSVQDISHRLYFKLSKLVNDEVATYSLVEERLSEDDDDGGTCTGAPCNQCKGHRSWFLGSIKSCTCQEVSTTANLRCNHSTTDSLFWWWPIVMYILSVLIHP